MQFRPSALSNPDYSYPDYKDGRMVRGFLHNIEQDAREMQELLTDDDSLPQWVSWKIYTAEDRLQAASRYMKREVIRGKTSKSKKARSNPSTDDYYQPTNVATVAAFLFIFGWLIRSRAKAGQK